MRSRSAWLAAAVIGLTLAGCGISDADNCDTAALPGIMVTVVDVLTGVKSASGVTLTVTEGSFREVYTVPSDPRHDSDPIGAVYGRPGTYDLTSDRAGYRTWT
ncbi:MAG: hypothetical protein ACT4R6_00170, partial [Gemmatimonadaceae bacterium]